jgi:hypothetical protein
VLSIFGPKREEVAGGWGKPLFEKLIIIRITKARKMRWAGDVASMGLEIHTEFWSKT